MAIKVMLLGLKMAVVDEVRDQLAVPDVELFTGSSVEELRAVLAGTSLDHVVMGAGLELEQRLGIVREIFESSDSTTVHLKDWASGPEGFLPFARAVLSGLHPA
ncbi:hypothetical protein [Nocardia crassostreae]|uniref:hypothetical protein n=1 Tax=Nocardia crassostreae TaxID=53428 RepID=UPI000834A91E|nr:hypothetical protein [Nocardia crassostreae]